jgi:hypothetical protein
VIAAGAGGAPPTDPSRASLQAPGTELWAPFAVADSKPEVRSKEAHLAARGRLLTVACRLRSQTPAEKCPAIDLGDLVVELSYVWTDDDRLKAMWLAAEPALVRVEMALRGSVFERQASQLTRALTDRHGAPQRVLPFPENVPAHLFEGPLEGAESLVSRWIHDRVVYDLKVAYRKGEASDEVKLFVAIFAYDNSMSGPWMDPWR